MCQIILKNLHNRYRYCYQSIETQECYYWILAEVAHRQLIDRQTSTIPSIVTTQVSGWQIVTDNSNSTHPASRYVQLSDLKKTQRDKLITTALAKVYSTTYSPSAQPSAYQYIETVSPN